MRKLIALFVVAILATSVSFAQVDYCDPVEATGTAYVTVLYPCIELIASNASVNVTVMPGQTSGDLQFQWQFLGAKGASYAFSGGAWGTMPPFISVVPSATNPTQTSVFGVGPTFNATSGYMHAFLDFAIHAAPGATATVTPHELVYTFTVDYN